jgi:Ca-activated chloride channel family protein
MDELSNFSSIFLAEFHFLRPHWLYALIPACIGYIWLLCRQKQAGSWDQVISPQLLPFLLDSVPVKQRRTLPFLALFGWILACLAMAGPTWERTPLPVHKQENALVILFDLSPSMLAQDLKPNRLTRARLKLIDLLKLREEGTTALIAYSGESFVVSPLTDDADTVAALVPALDPYIMPSKGSQVESAIEQAVELVLNAGLVQGSFLLVTDGVSASAQKTLNQTINEHGDFKLSILGIGTEDGAPIPLGNGGFAKDKSGSIVIPKLNIHNLQKLASLNGGHFIQLTADDADIQYLTEPFNIENDSPSKQLERAFDSWSDQGYWMVFPVLILLLLAFRRGLLACLVVAPILSIPQPSHALSWEDLWSRSDQQAAQAMSKGDTETAQQQFKDPDWKAAAAYRNGDFNTAVELYSNNANSKNKSNEGENQPNHYNQGNALAKSGKLEEAIKSYEQALTHNPDNEDAQFNKDLVEKLLQQQQQQQQQQQDGDSSNQDQQDGQQQDNQNGQQSDGDQSQGDLSQSEQNQKGQSEQNESQEENPQDSQSSQDSNNEDSDTESSKNEQESEQEHTPTEEPKLAEGSDSAEGSPQELSTEQMSEEERQAMEQWLRKIPDDPGGLLREKFRYEAKKRTYERRRGINQSPQQNEERW